MLNDTKHIKITLSPEATGERITLLHNWIA